MGTAHAESKRQAGRLAPRLLVWGSSPAAGTTGRDRARAGVGHGGALLLHDSGVRSPKQVSLKQRRRHNEHTDWVHHNRDPREGNDAAVLVRAALDRHVSDEEAAIGPEVVAGEGFKPA